MLTRKHVSGITHVQAIEQVFETQVFLGWQASIRESTERKLAPDHGLCGACNEMTSLAHWKPHRSNRGPFRALGTKRAVSPVSAVPAFKMVS
jgi:hypothetical protein